MRFLLQFPRLVIFVSSIVLAYVLYLQGSFHWLEQHLSSATPLSTLLAGMLFSFGFTGPFSVAYFIEIAPEVNPLSASILGGIGAFLSDLAIFRFAQVSFQEEYSKLIATRVALRIRALFHHERLTDRLKLWMRWTVAAVIIASPLPDEIGISFVVGLTKIESKRFGVLCLILNTAGIFAILIGTRLLR